jgi:hypothetical protein
MTAFGLNMGATMDTLEFTAFYGYAVADRIINPIHQRLRHAWLHFREKEHVYDWDDEQYLTVERNED